mmetsp:Transcript_32911/g.83532  ORF Transcript_32911/g.83532 Transcript_32911/m.83532 type:complete len:295 (-) Transcript_32911:274-1158(-)
MMTVCGPRRAYDALHPFMNPIRPSLRITSAAHANAPLYVEPPTNMRVLTTSRGLVIVVVTRPAIMEEVRCSCVPSCMPVVATTARLTSSYVAHWAAVRMAERTRPGMAPFHRPTTPSACTTARITPMEVVGTPGVWPAACRRVLISSMGDVTAAARPPLREPDRIFMLREGEPSGTRAVLMGVYRPRRAPPKKKPRAREGPRPLHRASTPSLRTTFRPVCTMPGGLPAPSLAAWLRASCRRTLITSRGFVAVLAVPTLMPLVRSSVRTDLGRKARVVVAATAASAGAAVGIAPC